MRLSIAGRIAVAFLLGLWFSGCAEPVEVNDGDANAAEGTNAGETERVEAGVGVGEKGRKTEGGLISQPVSTYFKTKERLTFMNVDRAMQIYKATPSGKGPATHEAFMTDIIEFNKIQLPQLPAGHRYIYDPEKEQLMVERPAG